MHIPARDAHPPLEPDAAGAQAGGGRGRSRRVVRDGRKLRAETWVGFHSFRHTCATILFRKGWNAVQVQRWLGHHKPSFTLDRYVHLLDQDVPKPTFFDALAGRCDHLGDQEQTKQAETLAMPKAENPSKSPETPDEPNEAETPAVNF
jgi:Phage integrase family